MIRFRRLLLLAVVSGFAFPTATAHADQASDILADLSASGVPGATIQLVAPVGDELTLRGSSSTLPMLRVTYRPPNSALLPGILHTYGTQAGRFHVDTGMEIVWELAILEAAKHELARGRRLSGVSVTMLRPAEPAQTIVFALPPATPPAQAPPTMSLTQVRDEVSAQLPATLEPEITVTNDAVGERIVQALVRVPAPLFAQAEVHTLAQALGREQWRLAPLGGNIGRVIVRVEDPVTAQPLYTAAHDMIYGHLSQWYHPLVAAWMRPMRAIAPASAEETVDDTKNGVLDQAAEAGVEAPATAPTLGGPR